MRTLKRTLCLVLAMTMVFGFFGVASAKNASEYPDYDDVQYKEALGVMTGIEVIDGMEGKLNPTGKVTRAQAAKMVAYAILGADVAKDLPVSASSFDDVNSYYDWAIPSIEYLVDRGILYGRSGVGGHYDPEGEVTAYEFAKMILCAAGYGENDEYKGDSWALNVAIDARRNGVFTSSNAGNMNDPATREECALYCFNGITKVDKVNWSKDEGAYVSAEKGTIAADVYGLESETTGVITANQATGAEDTCVSAYTVTDVDEKGEKTYGYKEFDFAAETGLDLLGHSVKMYTNGKTGDDQVVYHVEDLSTTVTVATLIAKVADFDKAFGEKAPEVAENVATFDQSWNVVSTEGSTLADVFATRSAYNSENSANPGVYVVSNKKIVAYLPPVAETATVMGAVSKDGKTVNIGLEAAKDVDNVVYTAEVEEEDVILVRTIGDMFYVSPVATVTGEYTATTEDKLGNKVITIDENSYTASALAENKGTLTNNSDLTSVTPTFGETYTLYLDGYGRFFAITADEGTTVTSDYYYGVKAFTNDVKDAYGKTTTLTKLQVVDMNGEVSNVVVGVTISDPKISIGNTTVDLSEPVLSFSDYTLADLRKELGESGKTFATPETLAKLKAAGLKKVDTAEAPTEDADGVLTIKKNVTEEKYDFDKDTTKIDITPTQIDPEDIKTTKAKAYVTADTNYIFVNKSLADIDVTTITGGINQTIAVDNIKVIATVDAQKNFVVKAIVFNGVESVQDTDDYLFFADDKQNPVDSAKGSTYEFYNADGEAANYTIAKETVMPEKPGFYSYTVKDDVYTLHYESELGMQFFTGAFGTDASTNVHQDFSVIGAKLVDLTEDGTRGSFTKFEGGEAVYVLVDEENEAFKTIFVMSESVDPEEPEEPEITEYNVTAPGAIDAADSKGAYSFSVDPTTAAEDNTVTVTVTCTTKPESGTDTVTIKYNGASIGTPLMFTDVGEKTCTFTMPASDVALIAECSNK